MAELRLRRRGADSGRVLYVVVLVIGSPPAILAAVRGQGPARFALVLVIGMLGSAALAGGAVALIFNGYVEDAGMAPARTLPFAISLLALGITASASAWRIATRP